MDANTRLVRTSRAMTSPVEDELVMFDTEAGKYYGFNEVATAIWNHLETELSVDELCGRLTEEFDISKDQCLQEVTSFLNTLNEKQLIEIR